MNPTILDCNITKSQYLSASVGWGPANFKIVATNGDVEFTVWIGENICRRMKWQRFTEQRGDAVKEVIPDESQLSLHLIDGEIRAFVPRAEMDKICARLEGTDEPD